MKVLAIVFAAVIAASVAIPQPSGLVQVVEEVAPSSVADLSEDFGRNIISDFITSLIQRISQSLKDMGFDPLHVDGVAFEYFLPVPSLFGIDASGQDILLSGISNIVINQLSYGLLSSRLIFDFCMPHVVVAVSDSDLMLRFMSHDLKTEFSGKMLIDDLGLAGTARVSYSLLGGINIRDVNFNFYLGKLSVSNFRLFGKNLTEPLTHFIDVKVFNAIKAHEGDISEMMEIIATRLIGQIFSTT